MKDNFEIKCNNNEYISDILKKYALHIKIDIKKLFFYYKGKYLSLDNKKKLKDLKNNEIKLLVLNNIKDNVSNNFASKNKKIKKQINKFIDFETPTPILPDIKETKIEYDIITCEKCNSIPKLILWSKNKVKIYCCECDKNEYKDISYFKKFVKKENKEELPDLLNCNYNKNHSTKAIEYCLQCTKYLCKECIKYHNISFEGKNHITVQQKINNQYYCQKEDHKEYILNRFCRTCYKYLCPKCVCPHKDEECFLFDNNKIRQKIEKIINNVTKVSNLIEAEEKNLNIFLKGIENKMKALRIKFEEYKERNNKILLFYKLLINNYLKINSIRNYNINNNIIINNNFDLENSEKIIKESDILNSDECLSSKYNKYYSFYMNKTHIRPANYAENIITQKFCNYNKIKKFIFFDEKIYVFIFYKNKYIFYINQNINNNINKIESNNEITKDIYRLPDKKFISINEKGGLIIWYLGGNNKITAVLEIVNVNYVVIDLFNQNNFFIIENNYKDIFNINYYDNSHIYFLLKEKKNYDIKNIIEDIGEILATSDFSIEEKDKKFLLNLIWNYNINDKKSIIYEIDNKLLSEVDNKCITLFKELKDKILNKNEIYFINTNFIIYIFLKEINNKDRKINKEDEVKIKYLLKFYELCFKIRRVYIYYFIIDNEITNIYNLHNEYLLFMVEEYLFIKYSISKREFTPTITNNFLNNSIDYKNIEIKHIIENKIILNDLKNKIFYIIDSDYFLLFNKSFKYRSSLIINENNLLFFDSINNNEVEFSLIDLSNFEYINNNQDLKEILKFKLDNIYPKLISCYNTKFIYLFEQNQLCIVNYNLKKMENKHKEYEIRSLKFKPKNTEIITPETCSSSGVYSSDYDESQLFSDNSYYCSTKGSNQFLFFDFDDEYYFTKVEIIYHSDYLKSSPKNYSVEIFDKKKRKINSYKLCNKNNKSEFIYLNEKGKYIKFNFVDNYGGNYIIINKIKFYVSIISILSS